MAITSLLDRLYYLGIIETDYFKKLTLPSVQRTLPKTVPDADDIERIFQQTKVMGRMGIRDRAILEVFYASGIRRAELAGLNLQDIDYHHHIITIRKGKGGADRRVPIAPRALTWVNQYLRELRGELATFDSGDALFLSNRGNRMHMGKLSELVGSYIRRSSIGKSGACHVFRHATATHMLQNGADIRYIQEMLGHKNISSTQIYTHVTINDLQTIYQSTHPSSLGEKRLCPQRRKPGNTLLIDN